MNRSYLNQTLEVSHPETKKVYTAKLFKPDRNTLGNYINQMNGILQQANPFKAGEDLLNNCIDTSDDDSKEIIKDDDLYIPAVNIIHELFHPFPSKTDKNEDGTYTISILNEAENKEYKLVVNKINRIVYSKTNPIFAQRNLIGGCEILIRELMITDKTDKEILSDDELYIPACLQMISIFNIGTAVLKKN